MRLGGSRAWAVSTQTCEISGCSLALGSAGQMGLESRSSVLIKTPLSQMNRDWFGGGRLVDMRQRTVDFHGITEGTASFLFIWKWLCLIELKKPEFGA